MHEGKLNVERKTCETLSKVTIQAYIYVVIIYFHKPIVSKYRAVYL